MGLQLTSNSTARMSSVISMDWANVTGKPGPVVGLGSLSSTGLITATDLIGGFSARTITGTANEITATNGSGVSGNPTLSLPTALTFTGKTVTGGAFASATITGAAITTSTYNGNTWTAGTGVLTLGAGKTLTGNSTLTLAGVDGKTLSVNNSLTLAGTDATTMTFPSTSATIARTDAANTFTGTQTIGALLATTVNGNTLTAGTYTLTGTAGKTLNFTNTLTLSGTDSTVMTFPTTSATIARTDAANTFTGTQTVGALLATTVNGNTFTSGTYTLTGTAGKTFTFSNTLTISGTDSSTLAVGVGGTLTGSSSAAVFYDNIPQNSQSAAYTTVLADAQKHILHPAADNNPRTFTIASNASVAYPTGTAITFVNMINAVTIAVTSDTMTLMGAGGTGNRTLAANGMATALKIASTSWVISGAGLT